MPVQTFDHQPASKHGDRKSPARPVANVPSRDSGGGLTLQRKASCACGGGCPRCNVESHPETIQTKLKISSPGDFDEQEADRVADQIMTTPEPVLQRSCATCAGDESSCPECEAEEEPLVQRTAIPGSVQHSADESFVNNLGAGRPLDVATRAFFEPRFGHNFSEVRVHTSDRAAESASAVEALSYTVGQDVVFAHGQYAPETSGGRKLLAHELTHVLQQRGAGYRLQRQAKDNCAPNERSSIEQAFLRADRDLGTVIDLMKTRPLSDAVKNAMWLAFRDDSVGAADHVSERLSFLKKHLSGAYFSCVNSSHPDYTRKCSASKTYGYVQAHLDGALETHFGPIHFCIPTFTDLPDFNKSRGVIHEGSHRFLGVTDSGYFSSPGSSNTLNCEETSRRGREQDADSGTEGDNPGVRLNNADSFACFTYFLVYAGSPEVAGRATKYRGGTLEIETITSGLGANIYTETETPTEPSFKIDKVPDNSGFRFRWKFLVGNQVFNPLSDRKNFTGAYNEDNKQVFIGKGARSMLVGSKERTGKIICEVKLFDVYGDITAPPDVIVEKEVYIQQGQDPADPRLPFERRS